MSAQHAYPHSHSHARDPQGYDRAFAVAVALNAGFVAIETAYGFAVSSMALLADAGHNLADVLGLLLAWGSVCLMRRAPTRRRTYGMGRSSVLAALLNAGLLLVAVGGVLWGAIGHLIEPVEVAGATVMGVAAAGVAVNAVSALLFRTGRKHDLNVGAAFLHLVADAAVSAGVVAAGAVVWLTGWEWVDPVVALAVGAAIAVGAWRLLRQSVDLALDAVPDRIDPAGVRAWLAAQPGVVEVHDLHIWAMSTAETALTVHLVKPQARIDDAWLASLCGELHERFHIEHATIQVENGGGAPCRLAPEHVI